MRETESPSNPSPIGDSTTPFQDSRPSAANRMNIALVPGTTPQQTVELQALLRRRLALAALVGTCVAFVALCILTPTMVIFSSNWSEWLLILTLFVHATVWAVVLRLRRDYSLRTLRAFELIFVGVIAAVVAWHTCDMLVWTRWPGIFAAYGEGSGSLQVPIKGTDVVWNWTFKPVGDRPIMTLAFYVNLYWFALIVTYALVTPNTWRRCTIIVGTMALIPMGIGLWAYLKEPSISWDMGRSFLFQIAFWNCFAAVIAIFGSHRIESLRREAFAARQLGQYRLKRLLGTGGMGEVYLAEHELLKRPCAVKLIRLERAGDPKHLRRFEREVQATAALTSWNTVEIFDYGHDADGTFYYVMEYLPGLNLEQMVVQHGPLPAGRAVHLLRQVCHALAEAHAAGLIHRDIKPSNIIACERGKLPDVAKLLDFGLVQVSSLGRGEEKLTQEGTIPGTPAYMSPEQAAAAEEADGRTDIYSLGAVAYFLLTGKPPFERRTGMEILAAHMHERPKPLTDVRAEVPGDVQEIVLRCLEKDRSRRFPDVDNLEDALARCACANTWTRELARAWWREHPESTATAS
jgi:serine/threonine-protein kinase